MADVRDPDVYYDPLRKKYVQRSRWLRRLRRIAAKHANALLSQKVKLQAAGMEIKDRTDECIKEWKKGARNG